MFKAKQKTVSLLVACLTLVLTMLFGFATLFTPTPLTTANAATTTYTYTFTAKQFTANGTKTLNNVDWTLAGDGGYWGYDGTKGQQLGSGSKPYKSLTLTSTEFNNVSKIVINTSGASSINASFTVSVGDTPVGSSTKLTTSATAYTFNPDSLTGAVEFSYTQTSKKAIYIKSITITYDEAAGSTCEHPSMSDTIDGTTKVWTCADCGYTYNQFQFTYSYPSNVTFNGEEDSTWETENESITLPTTTAPEGYVFAGWADAEITTPTTEKPTLYKDTHKVTASKTFYAVYHNDVEAGGWNLVTDVANLATDDVVTIVAPSKNVAIGTPSSDIFTYVAASFVEGVLQDSDNLTKLTLTKNDNGTYSFYTGSVYLALTSDGNKLHNTTSITTNSSWKITIDSESESVADIQSAAYTRYIRYNSSSPRFACYTSGQVDVKLYKYAEGGEISYTSVFCDHSGETTTTTEDATCTQDGSITVTCNNCGMEISHETITATGHVNQTTTTVDATCTTAGSITVTCDDCGETISTEEIPATGHNLGEGVVTVEPQVGVEGEITYTCQNENCDYTETESIPALDAEKFVVSYSVPTGIEAVTDSEAVVSGETVTLKSANNKLGYTFVGWVANELLEDTTECPEVFAAGEEYTVTENVTLYALYTYGTGSGNYVKVTENREDWSGEYLIVSEEGNVAFNSSLETLDAVSNTVAVEINDAVIIKTDALNNVTFTVAKEGDGYSIQANNGMYIGANSNANSLASQENALINSFNINEDDSIDIIGFGGAYLRYNAASNQLRFRYYKSSTYTDQKAIQLYALDGTAYYSTNFDCTADIDSANATVGAAITMNYHVNLAESLAANTTMQFVVGDSMYEVSPVKNGEKYTFSLPNLPPHLMTEIIVANLVCNGETIDTQGDYSVKIYAQNLLMANQSNTKLVNFLTAMLYYGDAAQKHQNHKLDSLATTGLEGLMATESEALPEETEKMSLVTEDKENCTAWFEGANVWFASVNKICVRINTTENVTLSINGATPVAVTSTTIYTEGIKATEFGNKVTFALYHNGVLQQTLEYSVYSYAYSMKDSAKVGELAKALYRYGVAAKAYND